ncbi:MAG: hypothetical protein NZ922_04860 [Candidatus Methanomethyliaceae archaeon]|nr:hypothetical protein [Candidatus Methanomethyliaceae archaeon]MDW7971381.1 hypothetical protein [Nitrososphaerota archaeon]
MSRKASDEVKIIAGVEAFSGFLYLLYFLAFSLFFYLSLSIISLIIALGLLRLYKWAWFLCLIMSIFGLTFGAITMVMFDFDPFSAVPKMIIDFILVLMLISRDVRSDFGIGF